MLVSKPKIVKTFQVTFNIERIPRRPLFTVAPAFQVIETGALRIGEIYPVRGHRMNQQHLLAIQGIVRSLNFVGDLLYRSARQEKQEQGDKWTLHSR